MCLPLPSCPGLDGCRLPATCLFMQCAAWEGKIYVYGGSTSGKPAALQLCAIRRGISCGGCCACAGGAAAARCRRAGNRAIILLTLASSCLRCRAAEPIMAEKGDQLAIVDPTQQTISMVDVRVGAMAWAERHSVHPSGSAGQTTGTARQA